MRVYFIAEPADIHPVALNAKVALQQPKQRRGAQRKLVHARRLRVGHAVDEGVQQLLHDALEHVDGEIQDQIDNRHGRQLPHDHAHEHGEGIEQQKAQHRRKKHLHGRPEGRRAEARADRPRKERRNKRQPCVEEQAGQIIRQKQRLAPDGQGSVKIGGVRPEQPGKLHPCKKSAEEKRQNGSVQPRVIEQRPLDLRKEILRADRDPAAVREQPQRQQQAVAGQQDKKRQRPPDGPAEDRPVKARDF